MSANKESTQKTIVVAFVLCLVCSFFVSTAAVVLRPMQKKNKELDMKKNILLAAGLMEPEKTVEELFANVETKLIDFATGEEVNDININQYDQIKASKKPETQVLIPDDKDIGGLKVRAKYGKVYFVREGSMYSQVILPVRCKGLWSTMYGFISLDIKDFNTVKGFAFYQHGETPGLGGEVDNPKWKKQWVGKKIFNDAGDIEAGLVKGQAPSGDPHKVDGLAGATITGNGVTKLFKYWFSDHGYGVYLERLKQDMLGIKYDTIKLDKFLKPRPEEI